MLNITKRICTNHQMKKNHAWLKSIPLKETLALWYGHSLPPTRFGGIPLQPTTWQVNRPSTCVF